jgi:hypothetical protein
MPMQHQEGLLTMMERGEFVSTEVRNTQTVPQESVGKVSPLAFIALAYL